MTLAVFLLKVKILCNFTGDCSKLLRYFLDCFFTFSPDFSGLIYLFG